MSLPGHAVYNNYTRMWMYIETHLLVHISRRTWRDGRGADNYCALCAGIVAVVASKNDGHDARFYPLEYGEGGYSCVQLDPERKRKRFPLPSPIFEYIWIFFILAL